MPTEFPEIVLFFDGVCNLCSHLVDFLLARDGAEKLHYAPLQGETFQEVAKQNPELLGLDTLVVAHRRPDGSRELLIRSRGVLFVLKQLGGGWKALAMILQVVPVPLADFCYRFVAAVRYRVFGRFDSVRLPAAAERGLFLS